MKYQALSSAELAAHAATLVNTVPAVYCGTYGKYNDGSLFGKWINLTSFDDYDEFIEFCHRLHHDEDDPEFMYQDYEGFPHCWYSESCMDRTTFDSIQEWWNLPEDERDAFEAYLNYKGSDATIEDFHDHYCGKWSCGADFAEDLLNQTGDLVDIPIWIRSCIDFGAIWRSLDTAGDYTIEDGYVFSRY